MRVARLPRSLKHFCSMSAAQALRSYSEYTQHINYLFKAHIELAQKRGTEWISYALRCWRTNCLRQCIVELAYRGIWACWRLRNVLCNVERHGVPGEGQSLQRRMGFIQ